MSVLEEKLKAMARDGECHCHDLLAALRKCRDHRIAWANCHDRLSLGQIWEEGQKDDDELLALLNGEGEKV